MNRHVGQGYREPVAAAFGLMPPRMRDRLAHVDFFCGVRSSFVGLWNPVHPPTREFADGQVIAYDDLAHCSHAHHQHHLPVNERRTTVVLPSADGWRQYPAETRPSVVAHELGHALHEIVGYDWIVAPITEYALRDRYEAFGEAFESWVMRDQAWPVLQERDPATVSLFESLS